MRIEKQPWGASFRWVEISGGLLPLGGAVAGCALEAHAGSWSIFWGTLEGFAAGWLLFAAVMLGLMLWVRRAERRLPKPPG